MIKVLKASAGSGKTFRLAKEYITLLLTGDELSYRHILAVTFTNKATAEMKQRILKELDLLAREPEKSDYFKDFVPALLSDATALQTRAKQRLAALLHDYSAFAVSTIDRFFQQTLKAFSREIGHFASYQIELDKEALAEETVDRLLDNLSEEDGGKDGSLLDWLTESVLQELEEGNRFSLDRQLDNMAGSLLSERFREMVTAAGIDEKKAFDRQHLKELIVKCRTLVQVYEKDVRDAAETILRLLKEHYGLEGTDLAASPKAAILGLVGEKDKKGIERPSDAFFKAAANPDAWLLKAARAKAPDIDRVLGEPMQRLVDLFGPRHKVYRTALALKGQLYNLGIAAELRQEFAKLQEEKNILNLDDSNGLLRDIIDGSDAPFVYEKTGVRYDHFLLDEFQDTSTVQWSNFLPLLRNSESDGGSNLIVGDVKQSIYRWRGSDWQLLDRGVQDSFRLPDSAIEPLVDNWRTFPQVVAVNNRFFLFAAAQLDLMEKNPDRSISRIYKDVWQTPQKGEPGEGCVEAVFCHERDEEILQVLLAIADYRAQGWDYGDIAILTRTNVQGAAVAEALIREKIPVISDDALAVKASVTVRRLVSQLSLILQPGDGEREDGSLTVSGYLARQMGLKAWKEEDSYHSLTDLAEAILRELRAYDAETYDSEVPYIQAFMDYLQDRVAIDGNDLSRFLQLWQEANPKIVPPEIGRSVRVMTIHKAKGLEFPCVILPFLDGLKLYDSRTRLWCIPETAGTELEGIADGAYRIPLSSGSNDTLFAASYFAEHHLQLIDTLNLLYVAMTRPKCNLRLISTLPTDTARKRLPAAFPVRDYTDGILRDGLEAIGEEPLSKWSEKSGICELLYAFARFGGLERIPLQDEDEPERYQTGLCVPKSRLREKESDTIEAIPATYPSYPLNGTPDQLVDEEGEAVPIGERNRLKFSAEAADFFGEDGATGFDASPRVMGTVLHGILSQVVYPETDLEPAVRDAVRCGLLPGSREGEILRILSERLSAIRVSHPDWFPTADSGVRILNETSLLDREGQIWRPDRVVMAADGQSATIIDYKFGKRNPGPAEADREIRGYLRQIGRYAALLREMGCPDVSAYLWYPLAGPEEAVITLRQPV